MRYLPAVPSVLMTAVLVLTACGDDPKASDLFTHSARPGGAGAPGGEAGGSSSGGSGLSAAGFGAGSGGLAPARGGVAGTGGPSGGSVQGGSDADPGSSGANDGGGSVAGATNGGATSGGASVAGAASAGAAGAPGAGGSGGKGGAAGSSSGGAGAASGAGTGGVSAGAAGRAGSGGTGEPENCSKLRSQADALLQEAQACQPDVRRSCAGFVTDECGCAVPVDDPGSAEARRYGDAIARLNERCTVACLAVLCREPTNAECSSTGSGAPRCVARGWRVNP